MKKIDKKIVLSASILGAITIAIGAFGAHGLEKLVDSESIVTFETAVRYQMYHAFLLLLVANFALSEKTKKVLLILLILGIILFSGSIYGLATNALTAFDFKKIALLTPIGGTLFIVSWLILLIQFLKSKR